MLAVALSLKIAFSLKNGAFYLTLKQHFGQTAKINAAKQMLRKVEGNRERGNMRQIDSVTARAEQGC